MTEGMSEGKRDKKCALSLLHQVQSVSFGSMSGTYVSRAAKHLADA